MKGKIQAVSDKGKWNSYKINDEWYSLWKDKGVFHKDEVVEFEYEVKGDFKNITKVLGIEQAPPTQAGSSSGGGEGAEMRRMSALKSAVAYYDSRDGTIEDVINASIRFSQFIMGKAAPAETMGPTDKDRINVKLELAGIPTKDFAEFLFTQHGIDYDGDDLSNVIAKVDEFIDHFRTQQASDEKNDIPF